MFLSEEKLEEKREVIFPKIEDENKDKEDLPEISCAAYELRVGSEAFISGENRLINLKEEGYIAIKPGMFASLLTYEKVEIPENLIGFISLKFGLKNNGLVNISGFHVDPGFKGHLVFTVFNLGPNPITLRYKEKAFLLFLAKLEGTSRYKGKHQNQSKLSSELISRITGEQIDFFQVKTKLSHLETKLNFLMGTGLASILALVALIINALLNK